MIKSKHFLIFILVLLTLCAGWLFATVTIEPAIIRYQRPHGGLSRVTVTTDDVNDVTLETDTEFHGYLKRVTIIPDGNDTSWKLYVTDADDVNLLAVTDVNMVAGNVSHTIESGVGLPFWGGLKFVIEDANDLAGTNIILKAYVEEAWRQ